MGVPSHPLSMLCNANGRAHGTKTEQVSVRHYNTEGHNEHRGGKTQQKVVERNENRHKYLSKSAPDLLPIKSWLMSDGPLHSAISASSVPMATSWTLSLAKHPESESLTNC